MTNLVLIGLGVFANFLKEKAELRQWFKDKYTEVTKVNTDGGTP